MHWVEASKFAISSKELTNFVKDFGIHLTSFQAEKASKVSVAIDQRGSHYSKQDNVYQSLSRGHQEVHRTTE